MVRPCPNTAGTWQSCTRAFTARVHGCSRRVRTRYTAVHYPNTAMCTAAYRAHGRLYGLCTRPLPCTDLVHGHARTVYIPMNSRVHGQRPCTRFVHGEHGRERPSTLSVNTTRWQQKLVGGLLLKSNNSFSRNRLVYVFGSRQLLGHNVGQVIAHAQLTLWTIWYSWLKDSKKFEQVLEQKISIGTTLVVR